jgi:hypothetical protein
MRAVALGRRARYTDSTIPITAAATEAKPTVNAPTLRERVQNPESAACDLEPEGAVVLAVVSLPLACAVETFTRGRLPVTTTFTA